MSQAKIQPRMTPDEFIAWQAEQDQNYELVDGVPVLPPKAMTGASRRHDTIVVNILSALRKKLRGKPCRPHTDDIALRGPSGNIRRPDVLVDCRSEPDRSTVSTEPRMLVDVLSPATTRFEQIEEYKRHEAVSVVLLVDSEDPKIIVWRRGSDGSWNSSMIQGAAGVIELPEIDTSLSMAEIYEDIGSA